MKKCLFLIVLPFFLAIQLPYTNSQSSNLSFRYLTTADGLSNDDITCILQDSRGFIWIGTNDGLNRYDGKEVKKYIFNPFDSLALHNNTIVQLYEDTKGYIWVFQNGPVQRFDPKTERFKGIHPNMYNEAFIRRRDIESAIDTTFIILQFITRGGQNPIFAYSSKGFYHTFLEKSDNTVWISSPGGLLIFDPSTQKTRPFPSQGSRLNEFDFKNSMLLYEDELGSIWVKTKTGIQKIDTEKEEVTNVIQDSSDYPFGLRRYRAFSNRILVDKRGKTWMGIDGLQIYNPSTAELEHYQHDENSFLGLSSNRIKCITEDDQGRVWIGTDKGVNIFDPSLSSIKHYYHNPSDPQSLPSNEVRGALENGNKGLWIFHKGFISYLDYHTRSFSTDHLYRNNDENKQFWGGGFKDKEGEIYALEYFPMQTLKYNSKKNKFFPHQADNLPEKLHPFIRTLPFIDSRGNQYYYSYMPGMRGRGGFLNDTLGLIRYHPVSGEWTKYHPGPDSPDSLFVNLINHMIEYSKDSSIWLATYTNGLYKFDPKSNKKTQYRFNLANPKGLSHNIPSLLFEDSHGNIWVRSGFGEGVEMIPQKAIQSDSFYTIKFNIGNSDLTSNKISGFNEDSRGNIWIGTLRGLFKYDFTSGTIKEFKFSNDRNILSYYESFSKGESGRFYLGTDKGLFSFHPDSIQLDTTPPRVYLTNLMIDNQAVPIKGSGGDTLDWSTPLERSMLFTEKIRLSYRQNDFTLDFSAINFSSPEQTTYEYRLENYDKVWKVTSAERSDVSYTNIAPGKYTFRVKAVNGDGYRSKEDTLHITITPPWYWSIWSKGIYLFLIGLFGYFLYRYLLKRELTAAENHRLKELDRVKTQIYTNITHEFRTPLTIISGMAVQIREHPQKWLQDGITMILRNTQSLLGLVNQMLDLRKLESGSMKVNMVHADVIPYLKYLLESFHSYAESKNIRVHFINSIDECRMDYDPEKLQQIVSNLMSNAIKFTPEGGDVYMLLEKVEGRPQLIIKVRDTGIGISEEKLSQVFERFYQADDSATREGEGTGVGLSLTKALVNLLEGDISVSSQPGKGSEFVVQLPITQQANPKDQKPEKKTLEVDVFPPTAFKSLMPSTTTTEDLPLALVVEDNADVIQYLTSCLEKNYQIIVAKNGEEGVLKALKFTPDIIISDVMMPKKDGFELTEMLKTDTRTSHIPIILLTAKADVRSKIEGLSRGADAYLPKPFDHKELLVRMQKLLELRQKLQKHYLALAKGDTPEAILDETLIQEEVMENDFVRQARQIVENNLTNYDFTVEDFFKALHMSHSQLHRKLTALTGYSSNKFIRHIRLEKAKSLLLHTDEPISNIAYDTGFKNPGYFSRLFKKEVGLMPTEYREKGEK